MRRHASRGDWVVCWVAAGNGVAARTASRRGSDCPSRPRDRRLVSPAPVAGIETHRSSGGTRLGRVGGTVERIRAVQAFQQEVAQRLGALRRELARHFGSDQQGHGEVLRHLLQTRCYADRLPQRRMRPPPRRAEGSDDGEPGLEPDAQGQRLHEVAVRGVGPARQQAARLAQQRLAGLQRLLRVPGAVGIGVPDREHGVAGDVLDDAAVLLDDVDRHAVEGVQQRRRLLGRPVLGEGREIADVGHQHADRPALHLQLARGIAGHQPPGHRRRQVGAQVRRESLALGAGQRVLGRRQRAGRQQRIQRRPGPGPPLVGLHQRRSRRRRRTAPPAPRRRWAGAWPAHRAAAPPPATGRRR